MVADQSEAEADAVHSVVETLADADVLLLLLQLQAVVADATKSKD